MRTAAKVFIILGMVFGCFFILPLIFGGIGLSKLSSARNKSELIGIGVCVLLFCSILGGVFMLCLRDEDFEEQPSISQNEGMPDVSTRIKKLKELKDSGAISEEEFEKLKKDIIDKI